MDSFAHGCHPTLLAYNWDTHTMFGHGKNLFNTGEGAEGIKACTALHLAVLHNNLDFVSEILSDSKYERASLDCLWLKRRIDCGFFFLILEDWTALSLALLLGNEDLS